MTKGYLIAQNVYLRPFERSDVNGPYRDWINDPEVIQFLASGTFPLTDDALLSYYESNISSNKQVLFAIIEKETDKHIGNARIYNVDWVNRKAHRGIMIGDKSCWSRGYGSEVINLISYYGFETLNLRKLSSTTVGDNVGIIKVNEKCGYRQEGRLREEFYRLGRYYDVVYWGFLKSEYLQLKEQGKLTGLLP